MSIFPKVRARTGEGIGVEVFIGFPELQDNPRTFLDADSVAGAASLSADAVNFAANQFIVIGQPGNIRTEIIQISAASSTTLTLIGTAQFAHNRGDLVRFVPYDKIRLYYSSDNVTFTQEVPDFVIRADASETYHARTADTSGYFYYAYFVNSSTALLSGVSATAPAAGFADNTIGSIKQRSLDEIGEKLGDLITNQNLNDWLQEARRMLDQNPAIFRWSFRTKFGQVLGQMLAGQWSIAAPTDLRDRNTYKNILSIRIGDQNRPVVYQDRVRFNQNYLNVLHSTINGAVLSGATSVVLTSTHDFPATGTLTVANNATQAVITTLTYTANNKATNTLSGVTYNTARAISNGTDVWMKQVQGLPTAYTIDNGVIYFDVPLKVDYDGMDAKIDYYSQIPAINLDSAAFDEPFPDVYVSFLKFRIKYKKANGRIDRDGDPDWKDWLDGSARVIAQEFPGQRLNFIPDVEGFLSATE